MKKLLIVLTIILLLTGCKIKIESHTDNDDNNDNNTVINTGSKLVFNNNIYSYSIEPNYKPVLLLDMGDYKVYSYNVKDIAINNKLLDKSNIDELFNELDKFNDVAVLTYKEGGSKMYVGPSMKILRCNALVDFGSTVKDVYIGDSSMTYKTNFCKPNNETVVKRFKVVKVEGTTVTLTRDNEMGEIYYNEDKELEVGKEYDFELMISENLIVEDTIEDLFTSGFLVEVRDVK